MAGTEEARRTPRVLILASFVLLWVSLLWFPEAATGRYLDQDWGLALGYFMKIRAQAGVDYVFTYGPLGYLLCPLYYPGLFGLKFAWAVSYAGACAVALVRFATLLPSRWLQLAWLWLALALLPRSELQPVVALVVLALLHLLEDTWSRPRLVATALLFAALGLARFTFFVLAGGLLVLLVAGAPRGRRGRVAGTLGGSFVGWLVLLWLVAGQSLSHLPRFFATSMELARGYSEAMSYDGGPKLLRAAFQGAAPLAVGAILVPPDAWRSRRRLSGLAMVAVGLFLAWKEGFVRQDAPHTVVLFAYVALATVMVAALSARRNDETRLLCGAFLAVAAVQSVAVLRGIEKETPSQVLSLERTWGYAEWALDILRAPLAHRDAAEVAWHAEEVVAALPAIQARVGRETLDSMTTDQGVVLRNRFNWHPRPVFQSYAAYTPRLALLNAEFLRREDAPRFVLTRWVSIDRRFSADDDGPALIELLRRYRPVLWERDYALLERLPRDRVGGGPGSTVVHRVLPFDERLPLSLDPKDLHTLSIKVKQTLRGKLTRFLFRTPRLVFFLEQGSHERKRYELVPDLAVVPFVLSPLFEGNYDVPLIYSGNGRRVVAIRLAGTEDVRAAFGDSVEITIRRYPGVAPGG